MDSTKHEIQLWKHYNATQITNNPEQDNTKALLQGKTPPVPQELQEHINAYPVKHDGEILYLDELKNNNIHLLHGKYSRTNYFNRTLEGHNKTQELNQYRALSASTHVLLTAGDNNNPTILYGTKTNQQNHVSGFGGFPQANTDYNTTDKHINLHQTIHNRLEPEITPEITKHLTEVRALGITYVNQPQLRGADMNFHAHIDADPKEVQARFKENAQFKKHLYTTPLDANAINKLYEELTQRKSTISPYAAGCATQAIHAYQGPKQAKKFAKNIEEHLQKHIRFGKNAPYNT